MDDGVFLESERLQLYPVGEQHATERYLGWLHNVEVNRYLEVGRFPQTLDKLKAYIKYQQEAGSLFLAIHVKTDGTQIGNIKTDSAHIGNIKIDSFTGIHQRAEFGIMIGEQNAWGKGYAVEAGSMVIEHCFRRLGLEKITLGVVAEHEAAVKLYRDKLRFKREGLFKRHLFTNGKLRDVIRMATFKEQWLTLTD